jgi:DNA polymerase-3 subunit beta
MIRKREGGILMELKIGAQELARALGRSQGIVEKKSTMPILSHVLLEAKKGNLLHVSATDLDLSVSSEHPCEVSRSTTKSQSTVPETS